MPDTITVELPNGKVLTYPAGMPVDQIQADAQAKMKAQPPVPFKEGTRPDTGTHLAQNAGPAFTGASLASMFMSPMLGMFGLGSKAAKGAGAAESLIGDEAGFQRALSGDLERIQGIKGTTNTPYPPNIKTEEGSADLVDRILGTSREGQPSPLKFHESAPEGMRKSVDTLKRQVKRRSPD